MRATVDTRSQPLRSSRGRTTTVFTLRDYCNTCSRHFLPIRLLRFSSVGPRIHPAPTARWRGRVNARSLMRDRSGAFPARRHSSPGVTQRLVSAIGARTSGRGGLPVGMPARTPIGWFAPYDWDSASGLTLLVTVLHRDPFRSRLQGGMAASPSVWAMHGRGCPFEWLRTAFRSVARGPRGRRFCGFPRCRADSLARQSISKRWSGALKGY